MTSKIQLRCIKDRTVPIWSGTERLLRQWCKTHHRPQQPPHRRVRRIHFQSGPVLAIVRSAVCQHQPKAAFWPTVYAVGISGFETDELDIKIRLVAT